MSQKIYNGGVFYSSGKLLVAELLKDDGIEVLFYRVGEKRAEFWGTFLSDKYPNSIVSRKPNSEGCDYYGGECVLITSSIDQPDPYAGPLIARVFPSKQEIEISMKVAEEKAVYKPYKLVDTNSIRYKLVLVE